MIEQTEAQRLADAWANAMTVRAHVDAGNAMAAELRRLEAEVQALRGAVPAGYVLVPVEPTFEQIEAAAKAAKHYMDECGGNSPTVVYKAMLAATPQPAPGYRLCEFCGCHTNAKRRACCEAGKAADTARGKKQ